MQNLQLFNVSPKIPEELSFLEKLSYNLWWSWHYDAIELFRRINPALWREENGNTRRFLNVLGQGRFEELAGDKGFLSHMRRVKADFEKDMEINVPATSGQGSQTIAYFSLEYGVHESIRLYSGGLGILSGDHLKAASDLQLPVVAVGLLYRQGYFRQLLDRNGWQVERYPENEINNMPIRKVVNNNNEDLIIKVRLFDRDIYAVIWKMEVGTVPLYLLDTEIPQNPPDFREVTWRLYGGDRRMRLHQELLLGIGGFRALVEMGYEPAACHINEGHAAFLSLARIAHLSNSKKIDVETAIQVVRRSNIFTTHTPVPAGNEVFNIDLIRPYLEALASEIHVDAGLIMKWGLPLDHDSREISMTIFGLNMAGYCNGVSRLHGEVARKMWKNLWPGRPLDEIPITHITNGVHVASWIAERNKIIYDHYLSPDWIDNPGSPRNKAMIENIPDEELWYSREMCRQSLIRHARMRLKKHMRQRKCSFKEISQTKSLLAQDVLTIGFARRFATYKRATLLLRNPERLKALLTDRERPLQIIFAGKAHPADDEGKRFIQQLVRFARDNDLTNQMVFLEDYDIGLARYMVQGVDVWLNTPQRPQEASGTSGMKAAINGVLNCSILDGWWVEGYMPGNGWAIDSDESYQDAEERDTIESQALFNLLESEIIPCFYDRSEGDLPQRWVRMMKESIKMALNHFSSARMVKEYYTSFYQPAVETYSSLLADNAAKAKELVAMQRRYEKFTGVVKIESPQTDREMNNVHIGDSFKVTTKVFLGEIKPEEVSVEIYYGPVDTQNVIVKSNKAAMKMSKDLGNNTYLYEYDIIFKHSGRFGMTARVIPAGNTWNSFIPGFVCWAV